MTKPWEKVQIKTDSGEYKEAVAPMIISASRATDIPAFYGKWLLERMNRGYMTWKNPFNQVKQYISFESARLFVFWTKNAKPFLKYLDEFDKKEINYYFQYTLNDYDEDKLEPNTQELNKRIETFKELSSRIGKEKVIWRFDPLILTKDISVTKLLKKIEGVGDKLNTYTDKFVFSYADIGIYKKVRSNLTKHNIEFIEFDKEKKEEVAKGIARLNNNWGLKVATCCEDIDLEKNRIEHNKCIDDELLIKLFSNDKVLMEFLGYEEEQQFDLFDAGMKTRPNLKDKGQRAVCGCIISKDIGEYNTCNHLCLYCYANTSPEIVSKNIKNHHYTNEGIL